VFSHSQQFLCRVPASAPARVPFVANSSTISRARGCACAQGRSSRGRLAQLRDYDGRMIGLYDTEELAAQAVHEAAVTPD
jgi:hypothetical protein